MEFWNFESFFYLLHAINSWKWMYNWQRYQSIHLMNVRMIVVDTEINAKLPQILDDKDRYTQVDPVVIYPGISCESD